MSGSGTTPERHGHGKLICGVAVLLVTLSAPWRTVDPDALSRLAIGRHVVATGAVPATDPFTFSDPSRGWSNPEWLADTLLYLVHAAGGETGAQLYKLTIIATGMLLVLLLATRAGATPLLAAGLLLLMLPGCVARFTLRNHIHAYWLVPLYGLVLQAALRDRRWLLVLVPLGAIWANLHASFPLGWLVLAATLVEWTARGGRPVGWLGAVLLVHLLLPFIGPDGARSYGQVIDHLIGADVYRTHIVEWQPPAAASSRLAELPLHLMALLGLASFLPAANRRHPGRLLLLVAGLIGAYMSTRFLPLLVVLAVPVVAPNLSRVLDASSSVRFRRVALGLFAAVALGIAAPAIWGARTDTRPHVLQRNDAPRGAARFLAAHASPGSRLFNPYNAGPWLLWLAGPRVQIYIDPRNNLGAEMLRHYVEDILPDPARFAREARRLRIDLALVDLTDDRYTVLGNHLDRDAGWRLVYLDGRFALYAVRDSALAGEGYRVIRARLDLGYLTAARPHDLHADLRLLRRQAPALADAVRAYRLLAYDGALPPASPPTAADAARRAAAAARLLDGALPRLPASPELMAYLATAMARAGNPAGSRQVLRSALALFPDAGVLRALETQVRSRGK